MVKFLINYDELPISVNLYLLPASREVDGKIISYMRESQKSKDWKKRFVSYLRREIIKQNWDKSLTEDGLWYLDCVFIQSRTNQDSNNYFKILADALVDEVIIDDKNLLIRTQRVLYDAKNPRFKAVLKKAPFVGIFNNSKVYDTFIESNCMNCKKYKRNCSIIRKAKEGRIQEDIYLAEDSYACHKIKP